MKRKSLQLLIASLFLFTNVHAAYASPTGQLPAFTALAAEADPHTGSANFAVPVEVPPGRGGIQPNIQLQYNSSSPDDILGVGWSLESGAVQRSSKGGVPRYDDTDTFLLIQNGGVQELVLDTVTGLYRGKVEGAFMKIERTAGSWKVTDKSGIQYFFGETQGSQEYDPADGSRIFKWCLDKVEDPHGNYMTVEYFRDENKLYPQDIRYTGNSQRGWPTFAQVAFEREARPEDQIDRYNTGFRTAMRYRISAITVKVDGNLQRRYALVYDDSRTTGRSLLTSIAQYGSDGSSPLPPVTFSYQTPKNPDFNYAVTPMNNSVAGDNLWNYRSAGSYDRGGSNYGPVPPGGFDVSWGPTYTQSSGGNWSTNSRGSLTFSAGQDSAHWFWTYLYIDGSIPKTLTVPYTTEGVDGVWVNQNYGTNASQSWTLQAGYNLVEMTFYNQNQGFSFNLNYNLADNVDLMSSGTVVLPQLSGDFNADGRTDVATFTAASGKIDVERSAGTTFAAKETWASGFGTNGKLVLGDFNGDGRMDIGGFDPAGGNWRVGLSDGSRFNDAGLWLSGFGANEEPSSGDFNGDGLADILTFYKASGNLYVRIALNKGGSFAALSGGQNILIGSSDDIPIVGDFNGDGQIDFGAFNKAGGNWTIRLNTGDILAGLKQLPAVSGFGAGRNTVVSDFNYDGLTDIGYYDDPTGKVVYRVSKGLSFAAAAQLPFVFNIKGPNTQIQSGDYNGDTLVDFAVYNLIGKLEIAFSSGVMPDILSSVENGLGGKSSIVFNAAVNYPQTFLPFPIQVVKSITQSNGLGESYTINNSYEQGLWDAQKREFRGFGLVRTTDPDGNYSDTFFAQDGIYKGRVTEQRTYDALGQLYGKTVNTWAYEEVAPGSDFIYLKRKDNFVYDGDATGRRSAEEFFFGETPQTGNLTKAVQLGEVDLSTGSDIGNDTRAVETAYVQNTSGGNWIAGLPRQTTVKDNAGNIVRQAWFYYDDQGNTAAPVKGLLTKKEDWAGTGNVNPVTQYSYDTIGNLLTTTDPKGNITRVTYDTTYNMFPLTTENALGHKVINEYYGVNGVALSGSDGLSGLWGQVKSTTDPNNQNGKRVYDVFGRATAAISPLDSIAFPTQTTSIEFLGSYTKVTTRQRVERGKAATVDTVSFIDGFGRLAQTKARSEVNGRYVINGQTQYDSRGLKSRQYLPAFSTNPMDVIDSIDTTRPNTLITYDAIGRPVRTTNPDGTFANVSYDDWTTSAVDENGHIQKSYFDAYGRLITKEEYLGADGRSPNYPAKNYALYATTLYSYDSEGNLIQTKDAYNNTTTITYDALGRKTAMTDPDMGNWSYQYDLNGNLTRQIDAKGQTLTFTYDALNRLTNKTDGINGTVNVNYTYDNASSANSKGRLAQAAYPGGNTQFAYDELGRELQSIKQMNAANYSVNRQYDALNNLAQVQYPDQKGVSYQYNAAGQIEAVTNDPTLVPPVTLNAPELYLIQTGSTELKLSWGSVIDAAGYKIKYGTSGGNYTTTLDAGGALSKVITGLTNDTAYYFAVAAYNASAESGNSSERSATPAAPALITMPSPLVQYAFNDSAANATVTDTGSGTHQATTEQTSAYTSDLTGSGTASASSCLGGCGGGYGPQKAFDNDFINYNGWVADNTKSGWLAYEFSSAQKINRYVIAPAGNIKPNDDANPHDWTFEGFNGSGWDVLDTRSYSSWIWQSPVTFNFANDTAYNKYRLNISANGGHVEVQLTEMEMMAYAPLYTNTIASSGKLNGAFDLNGTSQLVNADSLLDVKNRSVGSISLWLSPDSPSASDVVFSFGDTDGSNRVELRAGNDLEFYIANSVTALRVSLPNALIAGLWSHVVIAQDGNGIKGYVNGNEVAVTVLDQSLGRGAWFNSTWGLDNARIGCMRNNNQGNSNYYDGRLDDFRYYDYPLKASEVKALYNGGSGTEAKNPQYTEYTPLSRLQSGNEWWDAKNEQLAYSVSRIPYLVADQPNEIRNTDDEIRDTSDGMRDTRYEIRATKAFLSSVGEWLERNVLGVGEAEAQAALPDSFKQETSSNGLVSIETENYHGNVSPPAGTSRWDRVTTASQSGTGSMKANPNNGVTDDITYATASPRLDYKVKFVKTGTHYIWVRGIGATTADDSVHAGLDGQALTTSDKITGFTTSWTWSKTTADASAVATINVATTGEHTLNLWMREDGVVIDKIVVTSSATYTPSGTGPAESPQVVPAAPVLNTAVAGTGQVALSWGAVSGAAGYKVVRSLVSKSYGTTATDVGPAKTYAYKNLTNGTKYYFAVFAYNAAGQSIYSNELSATPIAAPVLNTATAGDKQVTLTWAAAAGATGYKIYYGTTSRVYGTPVSVGNLTSFTLTGLVNGTAYYFTVSGTNTSGESIRSNEMSATPVTLLAAPVLNVPTAGNGQVSLSWSTVAGATGYKVYYSTASGQYLAIPPVDAGGATTATVTGLTNGTMYYFTVSAVNAGGESRKSNEVNATPVAPVAAESPTLYIKNVDYNAAGQMTKVEYGNGDITTYTYNPLNLRLTRLYTVDKNGTALQDLNYTYDSVGNILSIDDKVNTADQTFKYDELNRLTEATGQGYGTKSYTYDPIGNIVAKDGKTYFYGGSNGGPHAVTALSDGTTFTYDADGNMVTKVEAGVTTAYTYDAENRLVKVTKNGSVIGQYEYDGDGGRTKKTATVSGQTTSTTFVGSLFETSGARNTKFIFLGGQRVAAVTNSPTLGSSTLYYHADHLGGA
ncbi:MAG: fibronectin type III domain-containing protein, partial [Candidatus Omnitrophica bacterium]|nr:fibronectin type III domain-containing protein [Candidatus Omnitrophota bacterium]